MNTQHRHEREFSLTKWENRRRPVCQPKGLGFGAEADTAWLKAQVMLFGQYSLIFQESELESGQSALAPPPAPTWGPQVQKAGSLWPLSMFTLNSCQFPQAWAGTPSLPR